MWSRLKAIAVKLNRRIGNPLEWESSSKAMLLGAVTCGLYLHYALWGELLLIQDADNHWIDQAHLASQLRWFYGFSFTSLLLIVGTYLVRQLKGDLVLFEYIASLYFGLSLCYFSYQVGTLSLPVGAVMVGAPVVGFIFFNRAAVMLALILSMLVQLALSFGAAWQWWPYAPMFHNTQGAMLSASPFVVFHMYFYTLPHMVFLITASYLVLRRWRDREEKVRLLSITDPLTGLFNRRSILVHLDQEQERSRKKGPALSLLMVDLDNFKSINDDRGHEAGDFALIAAADALQKSLRQNDRVGRYGGEEFLIILPGTDLEGAQTIAERCRQQLESTDVILAKGDRIKLTGSFGLVCNEGDVRMGVDEMLRRADRAMYRAKDGGRNQVVVDHMHGAA
ncbi:MAG: GGDEF domain-containing protein [Ketobacter sp.]|nr:GGDEF domain-containing protein [Ketobacter sp.]